MESIKKIIKDIKDNLIYKFDYLNIFNSPFKRPKLSFYFGEIAIGTPYFLPRKMIKNPEKEGYLKFVPRKFGFNLIYFGWKTKWDEYRFEWEPGISFVAFNKQIVLKITAPIDFRDVYWEAWLYYKYKTKGTQLDRIQQTIKEHSATWVRYSKNEDNISTNYYLQILKEKYLKFVI